MPDLSFGNAAWNTGSGGTGFGNNLGLSYGNSAPAAGSDLFGNIWSNLGLDMGTPFNPVNSGNGTITTGQVDGQTGFFASLAQLGAGLMGAMGIQNDAPANVYPASYGGSAAQGGGIDTRTLLLLSVAGVGLYLATR